MSSTNAGEGQHVRLTTAGNSAAFPYQEGLRWHVQEFYMREDNDLNRIKKPGQPGSVWDALTNHKRTILIANSSLSTTAFGVPGISRNTVFFSAQSLGELLIPLNFAANMRVDRSIQ